MQEAGCRTAMSFDHDFEIAGFALWRLAWAPRVRDDYK